MQSRCPCVATLVLSASRRVCAVLLANRLYLVLPSSYLCTLYLPLPRSVKAFARKHLSIRVRQIILHCARICFFSAPNYGFSHNIEPWIRLRQNYFLDFSKEILYKVIILSC